MGRRTILRQRDWGKAILNRLDDTYVPPELTRHVRAFKAAQMGLAAATRHARTERERRDAALQALGRADGTLERAVLGLGKRLAAAGLGPRWNPFARRSGFTPLQLVQLDHAREVAETERLLARFRGVRTATPVKKALAACSEASRSVEGARARVQASQQAYARALDVRDALLHKWTTALARLERRAKEVWADNPEMVAQIFLPLEEDEASTFLDLRPVLPNVMNGVHTS